MSDCKNKEYPWKQGLWYSKGNPYNLGTLEGNILFIKNLVCLDFPEEVKPYQTATWTHGDFGETSKDLKEATGSARCNVQMVMLGNKFSSVLNDSGTKLTLVGFSNSVETYEWISEDEIEKLKEDREPFDAPSSPYDKKGKQPLGKIYWISGPPGAGKSTTSQLLARKKGFVYFEADCAMIFANPFVDLNVENPTNAAFQQKPLKGVPKEMLEAFETSVEMFKVLATGNVENMDEKMKPLARVIAKMLKQQRQRLGGTWSVAQAIPSRSMRDYLRKELGQDLVFVVLNLSKDCIEKRLAMRHGDASEDFAGSMSKFYDIYERAGEDEPNAFNVDISFEMTPDDVLEEVFAKIQSHK